LNFLCGRLNCLPTDPRILDMDDYTKMWHFYSWIEEKEEKSKFMKDFGCFVGSFSNPEMAKKIKDMENGKSFKTTKDGFDFATKLVEEAAKKREEEDNNPRRRKKISIR